MKIIGTELKQTYEKERYLNLKNFEIQNAMSKVRLPSIKLNGIRLRKETDFVIEDEFHFLVDCPNYKKLRKSALKLSRVLNILI